MTDGHNIWRKLILSPNTCFSVSFTPTIAPQIPWADIATTAREYAVKALDPRSASGPLIPKV
eukprot:CAMPEP_0184319246 /NCGR_PEP_ID=MMETSP1049-20130417/107250_1 /TAXON_ID=77928 /ORGANISM="Proteomonas sulcata, Strain CCMP704" /LENGTH=61 /DNA_ID=CAMNT_0026639303 /DNA_START=160 /DNA_END=345 /DNA_ORIENTATION=-